MIKFVLIVRPSIHLPPLRAWNIETNPVIATIALRDIGAILKSMGWTYMRSRKPIGTSGVRKNEYKQGSLFVLGYHHVVAGEL
jgi:hypothetical protein